MMKKWIGMAIDSSKRFSYTIIFAFAFVFYKVLIEQTLKTDDTWYYVSICMLLMILSSGVIHLWAQEWRGSRKWLKLLGANLAVSLLWVAYTYYNYQLYGNDIPDVLVLQVIVLLVSLLAGFSVYPFLRRPGLGTHLLRLATNLAIAGLFSLVLMLGVAFILYTLFVLFHVDIYRALYDVAIMISHFVFPVIFLMMYPRYLWEQRDPDLISEDEKMNAEAHDTGDIQMVYRVVLNYIAMPLLLIYTLILYTYIVSTVISWEMPVNSFSYLVSFYLIVSLLTIYLLKGYETHRNVFEVWIHKSLGYFAVSLVIPTICMLYGMFVRIAYYGVTVPRYYILLLGFFALFALSMLFFLGKRAQSALVISFICVLLASGFGYFSASEVTFRSQVAQLTTIMGGDIALVTEDWDIDGVLSRISYEQKRVLESSVSVIVQLGYLPRINPALFDGRVYQYQYARYLDDGTNVAEIDVKQENYLQYYYKEGSEVYFASQTNDVWQLILSDHETVEIPNLIRIESNASTLAVYSSDGVLVDNVELADLIPVGYGIRDLFVKDVNYKLMLMIDHAYIPESTMDGAFRVIVTIIKNR